MVEFIELLFLTSLWIWGIHGFMQLTDLPRSLYELQIKLGLKPINLPYWIRKPLYDCPPCCSSIHGTIAYFTFTNYPSYHALTLWIAFCFCLCGLNYIIKEYLYGNV